MTNPGFQAQQMAQQAQQAAQQAQQQAARGAQDSYRLSQHRPPSAYRPARRGGFFSGLVTLVLFVVFVAIAVMLFRQVAPDTFSDLLSWFGDLS